MPTLIPRDSLELCKIVWNLAKVAFRAVSTRYKYFGKILVW